MAGEEKVIFVLKLLRPVHFHRFHKRISKELRQKSLESPPLVHEELALPKEEAHCISNLKKYIYSKEKRKVEGSKEGL